MPHLENKVSIGKNRAPYIMKSGGKSMIVLTKRQKDMLKFLCHQEDFVTFESLSKTFSVSKRSVQNDINQVDAFLKEKNFELIRKAGTGICIKGDDTRKYALSKELENMQIRNFSKSERHALIKTTLLCRPLCTFQDLADICLVSKQTVINSFLDIVADFQNENIKVNKMQGFGLQLQGEEIDLRRTFIQLINDNPCPQSVQTIAYEQGLFMKYDQEADAILLRIENECLFTFPNLSRLKIIIAYVLGRIDTEHVLPDNFEFADLSKQHDVEQIVQVVSEYIKIRNEQLYISTIILSERINQLSDVHISAVDEEHDEAYQISMFLIESLQSMQPIKQEYLQDTMQGLTLHLRSAINRYRNHLQIKNELIEQIKLSVSLIYEFTSRQLHKVEKQYGIEFDDNEIAYITMYIASIYETSFKKINNVKILLICSFGLATSSILKSRIIQSFPEFQIYGPLSQSKALEFLEHNEVDLIISTNDFECEKVPVINVNPLLDYKSMEKIKTRLDQFSYSKMCSHFIQSYAADNEIEQNKHYIHEYVVLENIQVMEECKDWKDAIQFAAVPLLKTQKINQHYVDSMIGAVINYGTYMVMTPNTAYVHAGANDGINENCTAILVMKKPILFGDTNSKTVSTIVILGIKDKHENDLLNIAYIFEKERNIKMLASPEITREMIISMHD